MGCLMRVAVARLSIVSLRHGHGPEPRCRAIAARLRATRPQCPLTPLAINWAALCVTRDGLIVGAVALLPIEGSLHAVGPAPRGLAPAAGLGAARPHLPLAPLAVHGTALQMAAILLGRIAGASRPAPGRLDRDCALARSHPSTAGDRTIRPIGPLTPLAIHGAPLGLASGLLCGRPVARLASVLSLGGGASSRLGAPSACLRASRPVSPLFKQAVHWARVRAAGIDSRRVALALCPSVHRDHADVAPPCALPATARLRACGPLVPASPLASHGAGVLIASGTLLALALAGLPAEGRLRDDFAGPCPQAAPAGPGAGRPRVPVAPCAIGRAPLRIASFFLP
mmetsp:Transcript_93013/g.259141  ORF Transcript_93013/g.259141 Transcript_93013/m.259141 type:complete len:341 (+) Transcript_93013:949-1971(+)